MRNRKSTALTIPIAMLIVLAVHSAAAQTPAPQIAPPTDVPPALAVPSGLELVLSARGSGSQIYTCKPAADGKFGWALKAPEAELRASDGKLIGHHFAGPTWKLNDGSEVTGKAAVARRFARRRFHPLAARECSQPRRHRPTRKGDHDSAPANPWRQASRLRLRRPAQRRRNKKHLHRRLLLLRA